MKKTLISLSVLAIVLASCTYKNLPPGQAKKITGSKSAKPYAPGQRKKM